MKQKASEQAMLRGPADQPRTTSGGCNPVGESGAGSYDPQLSQGELARLSTYSRFFVDSSPSAAGPRREA